MRSGGRGWTGWSGWGASGRAGEGEDNASIASSILGVPGDLRFGLTDKILPGTSSVTPAFPDLKLNSLILAIDCNISQALGDSMGAVIVLL